MITDASHHACFVIVHLDHPLRLPTYLPTLEAPMGKGVSRILPPLAIPRSIQSDTIPYHTIQKLHTHTHPKRNEAKAKQKEKRSEAAAAAAVEIHTRIHTIQDA
jgi:hypothetical protein